LDIARVGRIYDILSARSIYSLTSSDIDSLNLFAQEYGASYSLARSILPLLDTVFTPRYYVPGEITPRSSEFNKVAKSKIVEALVYPNPAFSSFFVEIPSDFPVMTDFELIDLNGKTLIQSKLRHGINTIDFSENRIVTSGFYFYRIFSEANMITSGKILLVN
jgi:hypothetical protein